MVGRTEARLCRDDGRRRRIAPRTARVRSTRRCGSPTSTPIRCCGAATCSSAATRGQVDVPRLREGNVALQVLAATTKSPRHLNIERNDDRSDDVVLLALGARLAARDVAPPAAAGAPPGVRVPTTSRPAPTGAFRVIRSRADLAAYEAARATDPTLTAGLLAIEGAHALDGDPANVEVVADAGFRMMSPSHFFDNAFGGSAHGIEKGGLTDAGREMVERMEARGMLVDVAHASAATIDDVLAMATPAGRRVAHRASAASPTTPAT